MSIHRTLRSQQQLWKRPKISYNKKNVLAQSEPRSDSVFADKNVFKKMSINLDERIAGCFCLTLQADQIKCIYNDWS
jgi:hypothetical protein